MKKTSDWVNIHDEKLMVSLGIHPRDYKIPNFSKTEKEKAMLRRMKRSAMPITTKMVSNNEASFPLYDKIIVYLLRNNSYKKQIYSSKIWMKDIQSYINSFVSKKGKNLVKYYFFNGKKYRANELPVNPYRCNGKNK